MHFFISGPLSQKDLGKKLLRSSGNMTMVIDNLEKRKFVGRKRGIKDRRIIGDQISGRSNSLPSQVPMIAPIKPTIAERIHPPRLNPTNWRAIEPVMAAIINRIIKSSNDTLSPKIVHPKIIFLYSNLNYKEQIHLLIIKKGILIFLCYIRKSILFIIIFKC